MRRMFFLLLSLLIWSAAGVNAQVTIGSNSDPHPGAVLDLQSGKGFKLPAVSIQHANVFQLSSEQLDEAAGMMVYNTNASITGGLGTGIYVWDGSLWTHVTVHVPIAGVSVASQDGTNPILINFDETLQLVATVLPANAANRDVTWSVYSGTAATVDQNGLVTGQQMCSDPSVVIRATSKADGSVYGDYHLTVTQKSVTGTVQGVSGTTYKTYSLPNGLGVWTANISEAGYGATSYNNGEHSGRGYYYTQNNAAAACSEVPGFRLPTDDEWNALKEYINDDPDYCEFDFVTGKPNLAGFYSTDNQAWIRWGEMSVYFSNGTKIYIAMSSGLLRDPAGQDNGELCSVRCIKNY